MMKKLNRSLLSATISSSMLAAAFVCHTGAQASDTEIYQAPQKGTTSLMFLLDTSGSMSQIQEDYMRGADGKYDVITYADGRKASGSNIRIDYTDKRHGPAFPRSFAYIPVNSSNKAYPQCEGPVPAHLNSTEGRRGMEYRCYRRIVRLKDAFIEVLTKKNGNEYEVDDEKIIGLANYSTYKEDGFGDNFTGTILVPARRLGDIVDGGKTQREILIEKIKNISYTGYTPTAHAYAEVASYLFGTSTSDGVAREYFGKNHSARPNPRRPDNYHTLLCQTFNADGTCSKFLDAWVKLPNAINNLMNSSNKVRTIKADVDIYGNVNIKPDGTFTYDTHKTVWQGGFYASTPSSKNGNVYKMPDSIKEQQVNTSKQLCSAQGIYVLTDGEPNMNHYGDLVWRAALRDNNFSCDVAGGGAWDCMHEASKRLLDPKKNPGKLRFITAVVGFGAGFNTVAAYDKTKSDEDNIKAVDEAKASNDVKNAAKWGIMGQGGWYSGNSSADVVNSINAFLNNLKVTMPEVNTGQVLVPVDPLSPLTIMDQGFYGSFKPVVDQKRVYWTGDVNKYDIKGNILTRADGSSVFDNQGLMKANPNGLWGTGMVSQMPLRGAPATNRTVFTDINTDGNNGLTQVTLDLLYNGKRLDVEPTKRIWLNILGYSVQLSGATLPKTPTLKELESHKAEQREMGALLHSTPILLTQQGKVERANGGINTKADRKDYVLYGSTQGMLHVVDSDTGQEKFTFVPQEMLKSQPLAFQASKNADGDMGYGIDGEWVAYTQYAGNREGTFTVKTDGTIKSSEAKELNGKGLQWVYGGLRMGGRSYYALDLSDISANSTNPKLKFHINPDGAPAGTALSYMGQSWSKPTLGFVKWGGESRLVMFVGGGYDEGYESRLYNQTNKKGAGVYMFDAHDGQLLWWASANTGTGATKSTTNAHLQYSVASSIATFDRNNDGTVDHLLFGDLGGQVFRVDLNGDSKTTTDFAQVYRIYNDHKDSGLSPRFYEEPVLSAHSDNTSNRFGIISIASGNRSSPLARGTESAKDAYYAIFDHSIFNPTNPPKNYNANWSASDTFVTLVDKSTEAVKAKNGDKFNRGWKYELSQESGQFKGFSTPFVVDNFAFLTTYTPDGGTVDAGNCGQGILGQSYREVFCLPGGVCEPQQLKKLFPDGKNTAGHGNVRPIHFGFAIGTVDSSIVNSGDSRYIQGGAGAGDGFDCTKAKDDPKHPNYGRCIMQLGNIANHSLRWYEYNPRS